MRKGNYLFIGVILCLSIYVIPRALQVKCKKADLIIFSFDRPLQLYALLESVEKYFSNVGNTQVIYRYSNGEFQHGYEEIQKQFEWVTFTAQSPVTPHQDFKCLTMNALQESPNKHVLFAVDDIIVTDVVDIATCINALENHNA